MESMKIYSFCREVIQESSNDPPPKERKKTQKTKKHKPNKLKAAALGIRYNLFSKDIVWAQ